MTIYKKSIFIFTSFLCILFSQSTFAQPEDPCNQLNGKWKGTYTYSRCQWETSLDVMSYKDNIRIILEVKPLGSRDCILKRLKYILTGSCKESFINLKFDDGVNATGQVIDNVMTWKTSDDGTAIFKKVTSS